MELINIIVAIFLLLSSPASCIEVEVLYDLDIQLADGDSPNEGRVLILWPGYTQRAALCLAGEADDTLASTMCRRLSYPFACGMAKAGAQHTNETLLENVTSVAFQHGCSGHPDYYSVGTCHLYRDEPGPRCQHADDMWLACGFAGMPGFELRQVPGPTYGPGGLLQGRCDQDHEWGAICGNSFSGNVACRELGLSDHALSITFVEFHAVDARHAPNYTLFVDTGCYGSESSLSQCQHFSMRICDSYLSVECYTEVREYDEVTYLCGSKQLCGELCQQIHPIVNESDIFHYCQCDDSCVLFNDCCYDHEDMCSPQTPLLHPGGFPNDMFGCVWVPGSQFTHIGYVVVSHCPISWSDEGTRDLCVKPVDIEDVIGSLPVFDDEGVDFKNVFCAICNGRSLESLNKWDVSGSDNGDDPTILFFHPTLNRTLPSKGWVITPPLGHDVIRKCGAHLVDTCPEEFRGTRTEDACRAYYAPIRVDRSHTRYRNPHCALCHREKLIPKNSCHDQVCMESCEPIPWGPCSGICSPYDRFLTIEVLFDLSSYSSITGTSCSDGQVYDPFLNKCRVLMCAAGYQIKGDACVPSTFSSEFDDHGNTTIMSCLFDRLGNSSSASEALAAGLMVIDITNSSQIVFVLVVSAREALDIQTAFNSTIELSWNNSLMTALLPCDISELSILLPLPVEVSGFCESEQVNQSIFEQYTGPVVSVAKFTSVIGTPEYLTDVISELCLKLFALTCSALVELEGSHYELDLKKGIRLLGTEAILSDDEYVLFPDGTAIVCSPAGPLNEGLEPQIRRAISFAGSILSQLSLAATFVTYCIFPDLRNTAGKSTMNFVAALFVAMLLFLLAGFLSQSDISCLLGAVMAHFFWLAAFCWMTLLCFNLTKTLASKTVKHQTVRRVERSLLVYMAIAWGIPLIIVSACLILHHCHCTGIPLIYAEDSFCWITDPTARLVAFTVPIAISLMLSISMYILTVINIRRNREASKAARKQGTLEAFGEEVSIYGKICALVGVTWVFGFISQSVTGVIAFSYIYIILNYLQGVFIFISFCLNKRVRGMWRQKLGVRWGGGSTDSTYPPRHGARTISTGLSAECQRKGSTEETRL